MKKRREKFKMEISLKKLSLALNLPLNKLAKDLDLPVGPVNESLDLTKKDNLEKFLHMKGDEMFEALGYEKWTDNYNTTSYIQFYNTDFAGVEQYIIEIHATEHSVFFQNYILDSEGKKAPTSVVLHQYELYALKTKLNELHIKDVIENEVM